MIKEEEEEAAVAKLGRRNEKQGQRGLVFGSSLFYSWESNIFVLAKDSHTPQFCN